MPNATAGEFWQLKETLLSEQVSIERITGGNGRRMGNRGNSDPAYVGKLAEVADFMADLISGRIPAYRLQEALSTSDFSTLMGDVFDRQLLGRYAEIAPTWPMYARRGTVRDFRTVRRIALDGLEGSYYPNYPKPELTEGREASLTETAYSYSVQVYEKQVAISWQVLVNDDLEAFATIPDRLARGARRTEDKFATALFVDASGPHASLYTTANKNQINTTNGAATSNPALSIAGLQDAFTVLARQVDADGEPIALDMVTLVVPPALEVIANNIVNATQLILGGLGQTGGGGVAAQQVQVANWMQRRMRVVTNPYIPIQATSANGSTSWFLFADPTTSRPSLEIGFLRGYETPSVWMKAPDMVRAGGGTPDPTMGNFDTGENRWKGMHILGGARLDPRTTVASNGSGS